MPLKQMEAASKVTIKGLQSVVGKELNGKVGGQLLTESPNNEEGGIPEKIDREGKMIKECSLIHVSQRDLTVCKDLILYYPRRMITRTSCFQGMFTKCNPKQTIQPYVAATDLADGDNHWAMPVMIEPQNGFDPWEWQSKCGVDRRIPLGPEKLDFSSHGMNVL